MGRGYAQAKGGSKAPAEPEVAREDATDAEKPKEQWVPDIRRSGCCPCMQGPGRLTCGDASKLYKRLYDDTEQLSFAHEHDLQASWPLLRPHELRTKFRLGGTYWGYIGEYRGTYLRDIFQI